MGREKFLVTGCAGFIGGHMVERLLAEGHAVVGIDNFSSGRAENMAGVKGRFEFIEGDVRDAAMTRRALLGVSRVVHLASVPSVPWSIDNPLENMRSSVETTVVLLEEAAKAGVERLVQASSSAVYGDGGASPRSEDMLPAPLSPYAAAKMAQEHYAAAFFSSHGLDSVSLRYFNVFGPRQDPDSEYAAVIPKFITLMLAGRQPTIYGDGSQSRDFIYVENVVAANLAAALRAEPLRGEAINIACGVGTDLNGLVAAINSELGSNINAVHVAARPGEILHSVADVSKARTLLDFAPVADLLEGLAKTVEYFRKL